MIGSGLFVIIDGLAVSPLVKIPVALAVALAVIRTSIRWRVEGRGVLKSVLIIGIGGSLAFHLFMLFPGGALGMLIGVAGFWLVTTFTLDHFFNVDYDRSYALTGGIVIPSLLIWLIIGAVLYTIAASS